jgi:triosephosphate isomerase
VDLIRPKRRKVVVGNWKSNGDTKFIQEFTEDVLNYIRFDSNAMDVLVAPTLLHIPKTNHLLASDVQVCA